VRGWGPVDHLDWPFVPIYEYRCPNGHTFEVFQRFADAPVERCQECGAGPVEKVLFPVAVHFKGSGFYSTDYGRGSRKGAGKDGDSDAGSTEKKEASTGSSTESSPTTKPEKKSDGGSKKKSDDG
jgi:putative FmdB family regulatory protein